MTSLTLLTAAFETRSMEEFMAWLFPPEWDSIAARILESGAQMSLTPCPWAPRWSLISPAVRPRFGATSTIETMVKSCIFRVHDCLHQLWGLPRPDNEYSDESFRTYKRAQMCGEVATLTLTEFVFVPHLVTKYPEFSAMLRARHAITLTESGGPMATCSVAQIAARLDGLLHKKIRPEWVRSSKDATAFCDDYVPMLERDRKEIDHNWTLMKSTGWHLPEDLPDARYDFRLDGLELTMWMIDDFFHLMRTGQGTDRALVRFNRERRSKIKLPDGWGQL